MTYSSMTLEPPDPPTIRCGSCNGPEVWSPDDLCDTCAETQSLYLLADTEAEDLIGALITEQANAFEHGNTGHGAWLAGEIADLIERAA